MQREAVPTDAASAGAKLAHLKELVAGTGGAIVAYSGGADSAFLADVAHEVLGDRFEAVTAVSPSLAPSERAAASALAADRGWPFREVLTQEMEREEYRRNGPDRCYHCKAELLDVVGPIAAERGWAVLVGTNADDAGDFRPGQKAAADRGALAPMLEAGLTKQQVRALSRERGLPTWDKPAAACLSSRIAYGVEVTPERLGRVARVEEALRGLGVRECRVRDHGDLARIEVPAADIARLAEPAVRDRLTAACKQVGFAYVTLDLEGFRSGSMNETLLAIGRRGTSAQAPEER